MCELRLNPIAAAICVGAAALGAMQPSCAASAGAPRIVNSTIEVQATVVHARVVGMQGSSSSSRSLLGRRRSSSTPERPGVLEVGVVEVRGPAVLHGAKITVNALAGGIDVQGATARIGTVHIGE